MFFKETDHMPREIKWSEEQTDFFRWYKGDYGACNAVERARAGTGKTTTIFGGLPLAYEFIRKEKIILLAFNRKNNKEFKARIAADPIFTNHPGLESKTTHGLGHRFITYYWKVKKLELDDKLEQRRVLAHLETTRRHLPKSTDPNVDPDEIPMAMVILITQIISKLKNIIPLFPKVNEAVALAQKFSLEPDNGWLKDGWKTELLCKLAIDVMKKTAVEKPRPGAAEAVISHDDMLWIPLIQNLARPWYNLVVVDEAQDLNRAQIELIKRAMKSDGRVAFVGDDRQAIYRFRGAESDALDILKKEFNCREFGLTITRRCGKKIVELAQRMVPDYKAAPDAPEGEIIDLAGPKVLETAKIGDFIVSRKNAPLMAICLGLIKRGIPAKVEGRDVAGGLKALILRQRGIKTAEALVNKLERWATRQIEKIVTRDPENDSAIQAIRDDYETIKALAEGCKTIDEVIAKIDVMFVEIEGSSDSSIVICSSVHKAKGLEADRVFVLADTLYSKSPTADAQEEENIAYVSITRAKNVLFMVRGEVT